MVPFAVKACIIKLLVRDLIWSKSVICNKVLVAKRGCCLCSRLAMMPLPSASHRATSCPWIQCGRAHRRYHLFFASWPVLRGEGNCSLPCGQRSSLSTRSTVLAQFNSLSGLATWLTWGLGARNSATGGTEVAPGGHPGIWTDQLWAGSVLVGAGLRGEKGLNLQYAEPLSEFRRSALIFTIATLHVVCSHLYSATDTGSSPLPFGCSASCPYKTQQKLELRTEPLQSFVKLYLILAR